MDIKKFYQTLDEVEKNLTEEEKLLKEDDINLTTINIQGFKEPDDKIPNSITIIGKNLQFKGIYMEDNDFKQHLLEKMNQQSKKWVRVESLAIGNIFLREMAVYYTANVFKFFVILFIGSTIFGLLTHWNVVSVFFLKFNAQTLIFFSLFFFIWKFFWCIKNNACNYRKI